MWGQGFRVQDLGRITCSRIEKTAHSVTRRSRLELDLRHHDPIPPFVGKRIGLSRKSGLISLIGIRELTELDRLANPISPKLVLRLRRFLYPRTCSGGILPNQAEREEIDRS